MKTVIPFFGDHGLVFTAYGAGAIIGFWLGNYGIPSRRNGPLTSQSQ
jgi:hypothetical protein